jgi:hypothetical protein
MAVHTLDKLHGCRDRVFEPFVLKNAALSGNELDLAHATHWAGRLGRFPFLRHGRTSFLRFAMGGVGER